MLRAITVVAIIVGSYASSLNAANLTGIYLETRTCQVYTGPCFANAESEGLAGRNAIMAWRFEQGKQGDVDLSGLSVVVVVTATDTLGFRGLDNARSMKTVLLLDEKASEKQRNALIEFVSETVPKATECVVRTDVKPIEMNLDLVKLEGRLKAGKEVVLNTRKAGREDCICMNETAYYPPLAKVEHFAPGVTVDGKFNGRGLGTRWSTPGDRSSYMATFSYE
ncbi:MAG: DUF1326 domain-containing protein [Pirellulaceae bacterium]